MAVNKVNVGKWVQALRSGEYAQTTAVLRSRVGEDGFAYCCLGVACEVAIADGVELERLTYEGCTEQPYRWVEEDSGPDDPKVSDSAGENNLPWLVQLWLGIEEQNPTLTADGLECIQANDDCNHTFAEIADMVEARYLTKEDK